MKILKILFILLVPALGFVSCEKSNMKPGCNGPHNQEQTTNAETAPTQVSSRPEAIDEEPANTDVVGSGDDDRDGGDKKTKKIR